MGHDHPLDRPASHGSGEKLFPGVLGRLVLDAGINDRPAVTILQQPEVDVVELHRQPHADPVNAGRDLDGLAGFRPGLPERIIKIAARARGRFRLAHRGPRNNSIGSTMGSPCAARQAALCSPPICRRTVICVFD